MNGETVLSRRTLLRGTLAAGALCVGAHVSACAGGARNLRPNQPGRALLTRVYLTILPTGVVSLAVHKAEIGQGVTTAYATFVAEELDVEPAAIDFHFADSRPEFRTTGIEGVPMFAIHATGGSTSVAEGYLPLRQAAAAAREMLVAAAAFAWQVPVSTCHASAGRVHHGPSGRSLGYGELTIKAADLEVPSQPALKPRAQWRFIGKYNARVDATAKVTGTAIYGIDVKVADMVCAYPIHGPTLGARPRSVQSAAARKAHGVIDVVSLAWGVAVVADKYWQARRAAKLVQVEWHEGPARSFNSRALAERARAHRERGAPLREAGDAAEAVSQAGARRFEAVYEAPYLAHAPLEPQNCVAKVVDGKVEIWAPCQSPTAIQEAVAEALEVSADDVLVHTTYCGGGFGRRLLGDFAVQAATTAREVGRPVKLIWSRESDMTQGYYRPQVLTFMRGAIDDQHRISALSYHSLSQPITLDSAESLRGGQPSWMPAFMRALTTRSLMGLAASNTGPDMFAAEGARDTPYQIPNLSIEYTPVSAPVAVASWRSVGHSTNAFAIESAIDELAHLAKADPYQFRRAHLRAGSREERVLDAVAALSKWGSPVPAGHGRGIARHTAFGTEAAEVVEVTLLNGRIRVTRVWCVVDCGLAINPDLVKAQLEGGIIFGLSAALDQEVQIVDGVVQERNFDTFPSLRMHECPQIEVVIADSAADPTGVGEPGVPPIGPAVANALFALTGKRLRSMPLQRAYDQEVAP